MRYVHREFRLSLGQIIFSSVFLDHSPGVELRHQCDHRAADFLNPLARDSVGVAIEEAGDDFLGQRLVKVFTVLPVLFLRFGPAANTDWGSSLVINNGAVLPERSELS